MKKKLLLVLILFPVVSVLFPLGNRDKTAQVMVTGVVHLVGTSLFPEIVIINAENTFFIAMEDMNKLHDLQHRTVTVEGEEYVIELQFANGRSAGIRHELRNIRIIKVY
jgi:hypothetical protein